MKALSIVVSLATLLVGCPSAQGQPTQLFAHQKPSHFYINMSNAAYYSFCDIKREGSAQAVSKNGRASAFNPEFMIGYRTPTGWQIEVGHGFGYSGGVGIKAYKEIGTEYWWSMPLARVPMRLYKHLPLGFSRFSLAPQLGLSYTFWWPSMRGSYSATTQSIAYANPARGAKTLSFYDLKRYHSLGYDVGIELQYQLSKNYQLGLRSCYTNSFSRRYVGRMTLEYDNYGVQQPTIISQSRLEAIAVAVSLQYQFGHQDTDL